MSGKSINFDDKKINKSNFYKNKIVSKKDSYGTKNSLKYFIGYNDGDVIRPLCIILSQMIGYVLSTLIVIRQCILRLVIISYEKSTIKYGEKLAVY